MATDLVPDSKILERPRSIRGRVRTLINEYPPSIWALISAIFVLWVGRGMVLPFTVIFFTQIVGLSGATVGSGIAAASLVGIAFITVTAVQIDKRGGRTVLIAAVIQMGGALCFIAALLIWRIVPAAPTTGEESVEDQGDAASGWRDVIGDRAFMYALAVLFAMVLGYTQLQMSIPPFLRAEADIGEGLIGALFFLNTFLVILVQVPIATRIDRGNPGLILPFGALFWAVAFGLMMGTVWHASLAVAVFVVFTAGEVIYMPISAIFTVRLAPKRLRGRYFSLASITWGGSFAIATLVAGLMQDAPRPILLWPVLVILMIVVGAAAFRLRNSPRLQPVQAIEETMPTAASEAPGL